MTELIQLDRQQVIDWLKTLPAERSFVYTSNTDCLFASFAKEALGEKDVMCGAAVIGLMNKHHNCEDCEDKYSIPYELRHPLVLLDGLSFTAAEALHAIENYKEDHD